MVRRHGVSAKGHMKERLIEARAERVNKAGAEVQCMLGKNLSAAALKETATINPPPKKSTVTIPDQPLARGTLQVLGVKHVSEIRGTGVHCCTKGPTMGADTCMSSVFNPPGGAWGFGVGTHNA